jgi:hypothetical protein
LAAACAAPIAAAVALSAAASVRVVEAFARELA